MMSANNTSSKVKAIAFYLPQYHTIPENNEWWGEGFTEWTNVKKARPLFSGHYQPHIPRELGYYDLRSNETQQIQADLAQSYEIYGFCYYHYWFNGKRLLNLPLDNLLQSGKPDFPFCLCWANENWTRVWDGGDNEILLEQKYSEEDDVQHIHWLSKVFKDERYIKINGRPLFLIYRANRLPNPIDTTNIWRAEAKKLGIEDLYLCRVESFSDEHSDPTKIGFDAAVEFQPDWGELGPKRVNIAYRDNAVYNYEEIVKRMLQKKRAQYKRFPCVTPSWDNTPRRKSKACLFIESDPVLYEKWLKGIINHNLPHNLDEKIIFINAWNEWGEGNHLEPDEKFGLAYLEATKRVLISAAAKNGVSLIRRFMSSLFRTSTDQSQGSDR